MDLLKAEIEKKRKLAQELKNGNKYVPRGELERKKLEELAEQQRQEQEAKRRKKEKKSSNDKSDTTEEKKDETFASRLPRTEVIRQLRARGEPITLFGETDIDREKRLLHLQELAPEPELHKGQQNDFQQTLKEINELVNKDGDDVVIKRSDEDDAKVKKKKDDKKREESYNREPTCKEEHCLFYFKKLLHEWEMELEQRPEAVKRSATGKSDMATFVQTCRYLNPLFKQLKRRQLQEDMIRHFSEIVDWLKQREYVRANDCYLRMAIGNAPWPIGVTMVGIHERSAREKIFSNQVAHILNDEQQRKYIQSVKRLMTFAQSKYPTDPSKSVLN